MRLTVKPAAQSAFGKLTTLLALMSISAAAAQTTQTTPQSYFGVNTLGAQVTYDTGQYALRFGAGGRTVVLVFGNGVGVDAAALFPLTGSLNSPSRFSIGAGLDANVYVSGFVDAGRASMSTACARMCWPTTKPG